METPACVMVGCEICNFVADWSVLADTEHYKDVDPVSCECCAKTADCVRKDCF